MAADDVAEVPTKEYFDAQQPAPMLPMRLGFGYINPQNGIANACPVDTSMEQREFHIARCVDVLKEAATIKRDETLMKDIRAWLRRQKDELGILLDNIG